MGDDKQVELSRLSLHTLLELHKKTWESGLSVIVEITVQQEARNIK